MGNSLIFQFLYINVLNYRNFGTKCLTFLKIKNVGKLKKNVYKRLLQPWTWYYSRREVCRNQCCDWVYFIRRRSFRLRKAAVFTDVYNSHLRALRVKRTVVKTSVEQQPLMVDLVKQRLLIFAPIAMSHYCQQLTLSVCPSVRMSQNFKLLLLFVSRRNQAILAVISQWPPLRNVVLWFLI